MGENGIVRRWCYTTLFVDSHSHTLLNHKLPDSQVKEYTGISERSLKRLRQTFKETGEVVRVPVCAGRPRSLTALDANVCYPFSGFSLYLTIPQFLEGCIERQPDSTLTELQDHLREVCGVETSTDTIARTLRRRGFTRKRVCV